MGTYTAAVQKLYVAYFSRPADTAGLTYWENVVTAAKGDTSAVAKAFAASQEYKDTFAGQTEYQVVNTIYKNLFGRDAEPAALAFWGQGLINKAFTIDNAVTSIAAGAQGTDLTAYNNKVSAATAFSAALDTSAEILGYVGTNANGLAKAWLNKVTTDASLTAAIDPAALNATVAAVTNPPVIGQTYTLTQGLDTINGTSANDTINAFAFNAVSGSDTTTLNSVDTIDGGAGNDVLNIEVKAAVGAAAAFNGTIAGTIKNVETVNIDNTGNALAAPAVDASKFEGATLVNQISKAGNVTGLATTATAGFQGIGAGAALSVTAAGATAAVSMTKVDETATLAIGGSKLTGVTVSGTRVDGVDPGTSVSALSLTVTAGTDVQTVTVNSAVSTNLTVNEALASTKSVTKVDASASTGKIAFSGDAATTTILTGSAGDVVSLAAATVKAATGVTAVDASVSTGAGDDTINVDTGNAGLATATGATTVDAGAGDDEVNIITRSSGKLTVNLGDGVDSFTSAVAINATDVIDAGAGVDTLALKLVGAANIGAFSNFDVFDAVDLNKNLDVDILASKNTVTEFVASGDVGAATLTNVGAGVGLRVTGDMDGSTLAFNQKTAGAVTITVDADESGDATDGYETVGASVSTNATSVKAVFDTAYLADTTAEKAAAATDDNYTTLALSATAATSVEIVSGGDNATNGITIAASDKLTAVTVSGAQALLINNITGATKLATIDASAQTGGVAVSTDLLANAGVIKLGSGADVITVGANSVAAGIEQISGIEKTAAVALSVAAADATAAAAAQADADVLYFGHVGAVANANAGVTTGTIAKGVLTFTGAGPADLAAAIAIADAAAETAGETVAFEYLGNTYVFQQSGGAADQIIKLVGLTGVTAIGEVGTTDTFFLV